MSAATEQQNNGDVVSVVDKVAADAVKDDLKAKPAVEDDATPVVSTDNGTASKDGDNDGEDATDTPPAKQDQVKAATKRPAESKSPESKKAKKDKVTADDEEEVLDEEEAFEDDGNECDSEIESDEYDIPYDGEEDEIECEDDDDDNDDGSGSDDQA